MRYLILAASAMAFLPALTAPAMAGPFTSRSGSTALVATCPSVALGAVCTPGYVLGSNDFGPGVVGTEDYNPNQFGLDSHSYAILRPAPGSLSNGSAIAFSVTDPASDLPVLKTGAFTRQNELGRYATSYSFMSTLSAFTYTGTEALPLSLIGSIDYRLDFAPIDYGNPLGAGSFPGSVGGIKARLVIGTESLYQGVTLSPDALVCGAAGVLASAGAESTYSGYYSGWGGTSQNLSLGLDASTACSGGGPVIIQPGDNFYVYAFLQTLAVQGATVDATNSFHVIFSPDTPQSVIDAFSAGAQAVGVPEPASWTLLIAGFGLTGAAMRRRRIVSVA